MSFTEHGGSSPSPKKILRKRDAPKVINEVRKMLQAMKKPTTLPTNYERIGQVGRSLAFMDRDDLYEYTWKTFLKEHNYKLSTTDRTCWPLNAIVGSPGSGKTRFMAEVLRQPHPSVAEHFENYIYIHAIYNNGNEVLDLDRKAPSRCIALRLLFHYFIEGPPHVNLSRVLGDLYRLTQHLDETEFNIYQVLELIREDYLHVHQLDNDTTVHIAIGVDEYNKFLTGAPGANSSFEIRQIVASLASSRLRPPPNTRVYVLLAGTSGNAIVDAGQFSSWIVQPHRLAPLSESSALTIIAKYFNSTEVYNDACLRNLLLDIGGHPRLLEWLVREIHEYSSIDEVNWTDVRCVLAKRMAVMWDSAHKPALESVIKAMFRRDPLSSDEPLSSALTVDCLEQRELGLRVDQHGVPYWPHLCLQAWTEQLSSRNPHLHQVLRFTLHRSTDGDLFTWQHFKHFCAQYMALRVACIDKRVVFIHQLLQGAMMAQGLREDNTELSIPRHDQQCSRVFTSNKTFPVQRTLIDEQGKCINWCNTGRVVVNNEGAPFDLFCHLAVDGLKHGYFICGQTKYYKATQLTLELVQAEVKKVKTAMKKAHFEHWVLLLVTTGQCDFSEREVPAKCAVVSARQFEHFFTNLFAERVHFRCTDTVNINTDPVWVLRRLDGLGKETAENIMRLRQKKPFVDAGDACRRIGHTKWNRIKDVIVF